MADILFYVFSSVALGSAILMVTRKNPVASLLYMIATLASVAGIYVLFEAHFLAAVQIMVYAGAIMVLFLFVIMLLNLGHDYRDDLKRGVWAIFAFIITGAMAGILASQFRGTEDSAVYQYFGGGKPLMPSWRSGERWGPSPILSLRITWWPSSSRGSFSWWLWSGP